MGAQGWWQRGGGKGWECRDVGAGMWAGLRAGMGKQGWGHRDGDGKAGMRAQVGGKKMEAGMGAGLRAGMGAQG